MQPDNVKDLDVVIRMFDLMEYIDDYSKILWNYCHIARINKMQLLQSLNHWKIPNDGNTKDVETAVLLKYLSKFWRTLEMPLINCV